MDEKQIAKIKEYLKVINKDIDSIEKDNKGLIDFIIGETGDRVQLYLNSKTIPSKLERILANIINTGIKKSLAVITSKDGIDQVVTSISDNGQSISYANEIKNYFTTVSDNELFSGFSNLLSRYRRVKVVYPQKNDWYNC